MQKLLLPLALAALVTHPAHAQTSADNRLLWSAANANIVEPTGQLTLPLALDLAFKLNPEITASMREIDASDGALRQAGIIPNPELETLVEDQQKATRTTTVQLNQPIELGGKRSARITAAQRGREAAIAESNAKRADIRAAVITAFYDLLAAQERHRLAQTSVELAQRGTMATSRRVTAGKISPVDETKARVAESVVRIELVQAAGDELNARKRLATTWGSVTPRFSSVEALGEVLPAMPPLEELTRRLQESPGLLRAKIEVERRQALTQIERSRHMPDATLSVGLKRDEQLGRNQAIFGVSIPLPFFDRNQGNIQEAAQRAHKAQDELTVTEVRLNSELAQAHARHATARAEVQLLQQEVLPGAQSAYDAATKGFELGKFNFLDVLDAQRTLLQARSQYVKALSETHRAAAEIERIVGIADPLTTSLLPAAGAR